MNEKNIFSGHKNLEQLIANMEPIKQPGAYVFISVKSLSGIPAELSVAQISEKEGITLVLPQQEADKRNFHYDFVASWITLNVHSSLEAVGLTAAFASELAKHQISCNVIAGYYHDHIFVKATEADKAMQVLKQMVNA